MSLIIVLLLIYYSPLLVRVVVLLLLKVHAELLDLELVEIDINQDDIRSQATDLIPRNLPAIHTVLLSMSQLQSHSQSNYLLTVDEVDDGFFIVAVFFVVEQRSPFCGRVYSRLTICRIILFSIMVEH